MKEKRDMNAMVTDVETQGRAAAKSMADLTRTVLMSSVGMAELALDEAKAFLDKLVERGAIAEKDARKLMIDLTRRSRDQADQALADTETQLIDTLARLGVPTKTDVAGLNAKVSQLATTLDGLIANRTAKAATSKPETIAPPGASAEVVTPDTPAEPTAPAAPTGKS